MFISVLNVLWWSEEHLQAMILPQNELAASPAKRGQQVYCFCLVLITILLRLPLRLVLAGSHAPMTRIRIAKR
jgi:hypothetical protein